MTEAEARGILLKFMQKIARAEYPVAWVGSTIWESPRAFLFEATLHKEGANPRDDYMHWIVKKDTGECGPDTA